MTVDSKNIFFFICKLLSPEITQIQETTNRKITLRGYLPKQIKVHRLLTKDYSARKLLTGFTNAALIAWKLTVTRAIHIADMPAAKNTHQLISIR